MGIRSRNWKFVAAFLTVAFVAQHASATVLGIPFFSQLDPRWKNGMICATVSATGWLSPCRCIDWPKLWDMTRWTPPNCTFRERSMICNKQLKPLPGHNHTYFCSKISPRRNIDGLTEYPSGPHMSVLPPAHLGSSRSKLEVARMLCASRVAAQLNGNALGTFRSPTAVWRTYPVRRHI